MMLVLTFLTSIISVHAQEVGEYEDMRNGKVYKTVQIGNQLWLAENLKVTEFSDGSSIQYVDNLEAWANLKTPAYCWYDNDIKNKDTYGALYNFYVAIDERNICPTRFHVPTEEDWKELEKYLSNHFNLGTNRYSRPSIAKSLASTSGWKIDSYNTSETFRICTDLTSNNKSGFNAVPSGILHGVFLGSGTTTSWWSSTKSKFNNGNLMMASLQNIWAHLHIAESPRKDGNSIRCVAY